MRGVLFGGTQLHTRAHKQLIYITSMKLPKSKRISFRASDFVIFKGIGKKSQETYIQVMLKTKYQFDVKTINRCISAGTEVFDLTNKN